MGENRGEDAGLPDHGLEGSGKVFLDEQETLVGMAAPLLFLNPNCGIYGSMGNRTQAFVRFVGRRWAGGQAWRSHRGA